MPGADNQQERLRLEGWVAGFSDGEGCFRVNINRCSATKLGWQVRPEVVVTQGARSVCVLRALSEFFGCGAIHRTPVATTIATMCFGGACGGVPTSKVGS